MANKEGYIGGPTGGVPEIIFSNPIKESDIRVGGVGMTQINGKSGNSLRYNVTQDKVFIEAADPFGRFRAFRTEGTGDTLSLNIRTKEGNPPQKHPDLYAYELVKRSISYFEEQGSQIRKISGLWVSGDNYKAYYDHLLAIQQRAPYKEEDKKDAARATWTGSLAYSLGFTEIESLQDTPSGLIKVLFSKPSSLIWHAKIY